MSFSHPQNSKEIKTSSVKRSTSVLIRSSGQVGIGTRATTAMPPQRHRTSRNRQVAGQKRPAQEPQPTGTQHGPVPARAMGSERRPTTPLVPPTAPNRNRPASTASDDLIVDADQDLFVLRSAGSEPSHADQPGHAPEDVQTRDNGNEAALSGIK